jgi:uncharacterized protein (TIGR02246 family)
MRFQAGFVVMALAIIPLSAHRASGQTPSTADIQKLLAENVSHRDAGQWDRYLDGFTSDATALSSAGRWEKGRAEMLKGLQEMFAAGVYKGARTKLAVESVQAIAPGVVLADVTWELSNLPGGGTRKGRAADILVKSGDTWKIAAARNMVPAPAGAIKSNP